MTDRKLMQQALDALNEALEVMKYDWIQIDSKWGPHTGGLEAAIDGRQVGYEYFQKTIAAITALRQAIEQAEQAQPVAWMYVNKDGECEQIEYGPTPDDHGVTPLYTAPPQRKPLTNKEIIDIDDEVMKAPRNYCIKFARAIEAAHGIRSNDAA